MPYLEGIGNMTIVYIVISILTVLFFFQQFGTSSIGKAFGPIMLLWFLMLAALGLYQLSIANDWHILKALNPYYAIRVLTVYPKGFWILAAVFLCTTGAEALYSDLGHCGRSNIRRSWTFVKTCLILNYLGQGAFLLGARRARYGTLRQRILFTRSCRIGSSFPVSLSPLLPPSLPARRLYRVPSRLLVRP